MVVGAIVISATAGVEEDKPVTMDKVVVAESKTHTLFMGADVSIGVDKQPYPVRDVVGSSWVIDVNGRQRTLSANKGPIDLKVVPSLKITEVSATILNLRSESAYSLQNDPSTKLTQSIAKAAELNAGHQAAVELSEAELVQAQTNASITAGVNNKDIPAIKAAGGIPIPMTPAEGAMNANRATARIQGELNQMSVSAGTDLETTGSRGFSAGFDSVEVSFGVSSAHKINNPYVVTVARLREKGAKAGYVRSLVYARAINPIDSRPTNVDFYEDGYPPGFEMLDFQLHLYNRGVEVATNVASKRVELTRDEAFEYVKVEYVGTHKGDTLPPVVAMGNPPAELSTRLAAGEYGDTYFVRVSKDGLPGDPFLDPACTRRVNDRFLESVVGSIRFKPALSKGRPVDGVAALDLNNLTI